MKLPRHSSTETRHRSIAALASLRRLARGAVAGMLIALCRIAADEAGESVFDELELQDLLRIAGTTVQNAPQAAWSLASEATTSPASGDWLTITFVVALLVTTVSVVYNLRNQ